MSEYLITHSTLTIPSNPEYLPGVRDLIESSAREAGFPLMEVQRIVTAAFEAVTNAATHGSPLGNKSTITIEVKTYLDKLVIQVIDHGPGLLGGELHSMPDVTSSRGRGIPLMRELVDRVEIKNNGGTKVTLTKYRRHK